jgi:dUTP pyrophosphatase
VDSKIEWVTRPVQLRCVHEYSPTQKSQGDVGLDLRAHTSGVLAAGETIVYSTGVWVEQIDYGYWLRLVTKSGTASQGVYVQGGVIDTGYKGQIGVILHNASTQAWRWKEGQGLAQLMIERAHYPAELVTVNGAAVVALQVERGVDGGLWR